LCSFSFLLVSYFYYFSCVAGCMGSRITIGMPAEANLAGPFQASEMQGASVLKRMHIDPKTHPRQLLHRKRLSTGKGRRPTESLETSS